MAKLVSYLFFQGNCFDAMEFYKECLGGELSVQTIGDSPMAANAPVETHNNVIHSALMNGKIELYASDMMTDDPRTVGNAIDLCLTCDSKEEIESLYEKLSEGGDAVDPLKEEFFGTFGALKDKFGIRWMFEMDKK